MIVYKITNRINGKVYIGQTIRKLTERWQHHCCDKSCCHALKSAIQKYGKENFTVEQIDVACDRDELDKKEQYWIKFYDSMNHKKGYNLTSGGEHPVFSASSLSKKKASLKKYYSTDEGKISKREATKKQWTNQERKETLRKMMKGNNNASKPVMCIETGEVFDCCLSARNKYNMSASSFRLCLRGKHNTCKGYHWKFIN